MKRRCVEGYNGVVWFYNSIVVSIELKKKLGLNGVRVWCGLSKGADMRFDWSKKNDTRTI